ncbi:MAG: hypothetical protein Q4B32_02725 [Clostridia bacterium]|nr:hypothetical protein [Clostridia bacterium]
MTISTTAANIVVLYGDEAAKHFVDLVKQWDKLLNADGWASLYFLIVSSHDQEYNQLTQEEWNRVSPITTYLNINEQPLSTNEYAEIAWRLPNAGSPKLHLICAAGREHCTYDWLESFTQNVLKDDVHFTQFLLYYVLGRDSLPDEKNGMHRVLQTIQGQGHHDHVFLIGDTDDGGQKVNSDAMWNALYLSAVMNCADKLHLSTETYSVGYSVLNANGSELENLRLAASCLAVQERLQEGELSSAEAVPALLPSGVASVSALEEWLKKTVRESVRIAKSDFGNAWITIRMDADLDETETCKRLKRFVDMNYCQSATMAERAESFAQQVKNEVVDRLCRTPKAAIMPASAAGDIASALERMSKDDVPAIRCTFGKKPFLKTAGRMSQYVEENKEAAFKAAGTHAMQLNMQTYANALAQAYRSIEEWLNRMHSGKVPEMDIVAYLQRRMRKLEKPESGNTDYLRTKKYPKYWKELTNLHPALQEITENMESEAQYFDENGNYVEAGWESLLASAQQVLRDQLPGRMSLRFFDVLHAEFDDEKLTEFFADYLKPGRRMYYNMRAIVGNAQSFYLVDEDLASAWKNAPEGLFEVQTDNAENLTLYPIEGSGEQSWILDSGEAYFHGASMGRLSKLADREQGQSPVTSQRKISNLASSQKAHSAPAERHEETDTHGLKLQPNAQNHYMLSWDWQGNDQLAKITITQLGEQVGFDVVDVKTFKKNNGQFDVTAKMMGGKPIPYGELTVTIYSGEGKTPYIDRATVMGRCEQVNYSIKGSKLEMKQAAPGVLNRVALRITNKEGKWLYYPLYAGNEDHPYTFERLNLDDAKVVQAPTEQTDSKKVPIFIQQV